MSQSPDRLFTPGPTEIPHAVQAAMALPMIHHRTPQFESLFEQTQKLLKQIYQTQNDVITFSASGTGGMDAAVCNFFSKGDEVVVINAGKFGERWEKLAKTYGLKAHVITYDPGVPGDPKAIQDILTQEKNIKGVFFQASETSTATFHPVKEIAKVVHDHSDALVVVDGVTAIGIHDIKTDAWGLDVVVAGSQKGFMMPPGLGFISVSEKAWQRADHSDLPKFYLDAKQERKAQRNNTTAFTPAVSLIRGLHAACELMLASGLDALFQKHLIMTHAMHAAAKALNLELVAEKNPSHCLTAFFIPEEIGAGKVKKALETDHHMIIAGGQDALKGKIIRIAHFGALTFSDVTAVMAALELTLHKFGAQVNLGAATTATLKVFSKANI
jgi:serine---pyruvate transaminase